MAALGEGCCTINGTLLGKGERTGNAPLEAVIMHMMGMGFFTKNPPQFSKLNALVELYDSMGQGIPAKYPLFGRDAHRTRAGIHADGLNKFWWMYAPFDVPKLLGRPLEVSLTKDSGIAGLIFMIKQHLGIDLPKEDRELQNLHAALTAEFDKGRQTSVEWEEIGETVRERFLGSPHERKLLAR
jgi:isopropylmalate/homocitrate/citramalate synthase